MKPIAVFYHCLMRNADPPITVMTTTNILVEQMRALNLSGLTDAAKTIVVGCNGDSIDAMAVGCLIPKEAQLFWWPGGCSEIPTLKYMHDWSKQHLGWNVLYHHMKGATYPKNKMWITWRRCMEMACVWNWERCVEELELGAESCGAHWLTRRLLPHDRNCPYWGGNFWWATSDFIATLKPLPEDSVKNRYEAELWIHSGSRLPRVHDFAPHHPMRCHET